MNSDVLNQRKRRKRAKDNSITRAVKLKVDNNKKKKQTNK